VVAPNNLSVLLDDGAAPLGRVIYSTTVTLPTGVPRQQVLLSFADQLGSTSEVIEKSTGELVESISYGSQGVTNDDYRPARWASFREPYRFTGKEEDIELGLM